MMRRLGATDEEEEEEEEGETCTSSFEDKYHDALDEIISLTSENEDLKRRIVELEEEGPDDEMRIEALIKENRELRVIGANLDVEGECRKVERKWERVVERCYVYEEGLVASLAKEREVRTSLSPLWRVRESY